ncbi:MAG TPA: carbohydrate porin [Pseudolabrys sp.]|nr:carbohydrate porin [Pseudolabrys sp.]
MQAEPNAAKPASADDQRDKPADKQQGKPKENKAATAAKEDKEEEHKPADPDTGKSTLSNDTLGLLPNEKQGIKFTLSTIEEILSNVSGGLKRGAVYDGRTNFAVDLDLDKLAGRKGLLFHANAFQIHGRQFSRDYVGNLMTASSIEAQATTRLYEAWFEQKFFNDKWSIRAGQLAADTEFITTRFSDAFINSTYGWPAIFGVNMPSGGPSPPLAAVGARVKAELNEHVTALAAIFNGDPAGPGADDPQSRNRYGLNFRVNDPPLMIGEVQYAYNQEKHAKGLPGTIKFGGWYHTGLFSDQRLSANGLSQADPAAAATPLQHRGDYGLYGVAEQQLVHFTGSDAARGIGVFVRASGSPSDRNLIDFYADGGIEVIGPSEQRPHDKIGLGLAYARISDAARALDRDYQVLTGSTRPIRNYEALVALSYLLEIRTGWTLHPTLQYIVHPGGGYVTPDGIPTVVKNAVVLGLRTVVKF